MGPRKMSHRCRAAIISHSAAAGNPRLEAFLRLGEPHNNPVLGPSRKTEFSSRVLIHEAGLAHRRGRALLNVCRVQSFLFVFNRGIEAANLNVRSALSFLP